MTAQVVIKPTFLLKGINPFALTEEYEKGIILKSLVLEKVKIATVALNNNRGKSFRQAIYSFRNRDNFIHTIATTGAKTFTFYDEKKEIKKGGVCMICRDQFKGPSIGIILGLKEDTGQPGNIIVYTLGSTCGFRCSLRLTRYLRQMTKKIKFIHSEQFLHFVYSKMYPNSQSLTPSPDPLLHELNDGSLSKEEYDDPKYVYVDVPNLIFYPAKEQYIKLRISN